MAAPVTTLTFRHVPRSGALESSARDMISRLQKLPHRMTACHIVLEGDAEAPGVDYRVKIHLSVPGAQIHAESASKVRHAEGRNALDSAYESVKRQLEKLKQVHHRPDVARP
jgi:ribosome-associated translation inhibitor RaiA